MAGRLEIHLSPVMARWMEGARASGAAVAGERREGERRGGLSRAREVQHLPAAFGFTAHAVEIPKGWRWVLLAQGIPWHRPSGHLPVPPPRHRWTLGAKSLVAPSNRMTLSSAQHRRLPPVLQTCWFLLFPPVLRGLTTPRQHRGAHGHRRTPTV